MNKSTTAAELAAHWRTITLLALLVLIFTGCAKPVVYVQVDRPAQLNTSGIKRMAVMPFTADENAYSFLAQYATSAVADRVRATNRFTLVDASEVARLRQSGQSVENYVDAMFTGRITRAVYTRDTKTSAGWTDKKGRYYPPTTTYYTSVEVEFTYSIVRARDGSLIGPISKRGVKSASDGSGYPSAEALMRDALAEQINTIGRDIAPYTSREARTFAEEKNNSMIKDEMKQAMEHVKAQNYKVALEAYLRIYNQHKSVAAAENAAILYEAIGDPEAALSLLQKVYEDTGNPNLQLKISMLNKNLEDKAKVENTDKEVVQNPTDRVTAVTIEEIQKVLPSSAVVWFYNNSPGNTMVEAIVDNLTADFIRKGISLVDRQNAALVEEEQKLHVSGAVNDAEIVRIGNAAGAKAIVIIGITGSGAMRRLQVRVLDIERGVPIFQSDTNEKWQL